VRERPWTRHVGLLKDGLDAAELRACVAATGSHRW
jgi:hypothetical protein